MYAGQTKSFDIKDFTEAFGKAVDAKGLASAFRSPPDLRDAAESLVANVRHGADLLIRLISKPAVRSSAEPDNHSSTLARFNGILEARNGQVFAPTLEKLSRQLPYLLEDEDELAALLLPPDARSFETLLAYLGARRWIKVPSLTLTRNGIFVANWRSAPDAKARLSIDFLDEKRVRWSAVDARVVEASTMIGGTCLISDLDKHLRFYRGWLRR